MNTEKHQVAAVIDSAAAFDIYHDSTGRVPPDIPPGMNTIREHFTVIPQGDTVPRAALLIRQRGFKQTPEEAARGDEVNGLSVYVATDADEETGHRLLDDFVSHVENDGGHDIRIISATDRRNK